MQQAVNDLRSMIDSIPLVTRYLVMGTVVLSLGAQLGLCSVRQLILYYGGVFERFQVWRLITCHLLTGGQGLIWHLFMLYQNSKHLEESHFATRPGDYAYAVLLMMGCLDAVSIYMQTPVMTSAFGMAVTTLYSLVNAESIVNFMFGFQFKAKFLPFVMIGFDLLMGGDWKLPLIGVGVGYLYNYLDLNQRRLTTAPQFIKDWYPDNMRVQGFSGPVQPPTQTTRRQWGTGYRLGSD
ncbi:Der1-like family-domain-containing protein [Gorgonomyces haynaldii]|nr:Der1-like family-domain-containing protein [Gorgonomyces haynaldii]